MSSPSSTTVQAATTTTDRHWCGIPIGTIQGYCDQWQHDGHDECHDQNPEGDAKCTRPLLLDVRSDEQCNCKDQQQSNNTNSDDQRRGSSIPGAVRIPLASLRQRSYELPPRQVPLVLLVGGSPPPLSTTATTTARNKSRQDLQVLREFLWGSNDQQRRAQKPWNVVSIIFAEDTRNDWSRTFCDYRIPIANSNNDIGFTALARLWQPDPMVERVLLPLLQERLLSLIKNTTNNSTCYEVWDLGSGSGRDVCFLAEELKRTISTTTANRNNCMHSTSQCKFCVVGWDQRYQCREDDEVECVKFWNRRGVGNVTRCATVKFGTTSSQADQWLKQQLGKQRQPTDGVNNNDDGDEDSLPKHNDTATPPPSPSKRPRPAATAILQPPQREQLICLLAVRFWNSGLMESVARSQMILPGTLVAISHFCKPYSGAPWNFDHPKEKHVLERDELEHWFASSSNWTILHDEIAMDSDHGRTLLHFIARKNKLQYF